VTQPARGLPSATLLIEARAALAPRADPAAGGFTGASSIAALLFLLDRARDGDDEAARLALAVLRPLSWGVLAAHPPDPPSRLSRRRSEFAAAHLAGPLRGPGASESRSARRLVRGSNALTSACAAAAEAAVHVEAVDVRRDDGLEKTARAALDAALATFGWNAEAPLAPPSSMEDQGTDADGLMIAALARASLTFDAPGYREAASRAGERALDHRSVAKGGTLLHLAGEPPRVAGLGDYALLVRGLLELLPATGEKGWLHEAVRLQGEQEQRLGDVREGGYFESPEGAGRSARKSGSDGSFLSGNGISTLNLIDLFRLTGERSYRDRAEGVLRAFAPEIAREPLAHLTLLRAAQRFQRTPSAA
jgi:hypothetical protein